MQKTISSSRNKTHRHQKVVFPTFVCIAIGEIVTIVLTLIFALVFSFVDLPPVAVNCFTLAALAVGAVVTGHICAKIFPRERGLMALICGLMMTILLVLLNLIIYQEPITLFSFGKYAAILGGCFAGAAATNPNLVRKNKKKLRKYP